MKECELVIVVKFIVKHTTLNLEHNKRCVFLKNVVMMKISSRGVSER